VRPWPEQHKTLAKVFALALLGAAVTFIFLIRPLLEDVGIARDEVAEKEGKLKKTGWAIDPERLTSLREEKDRNLKRVKKLSEEVLAQCTAMFAPKIAAFYDPNEDFRNVVSRLDFQSEYDDFDRKMRSRGVILAEQELGLGENTDSPYTYQLMLQLWTLEDLMALALDRRLMPARDPAVRVATEGRKYLLASKLNVLPVRGYFLNPKDKEPFILEIPIRMTLVGKVDDFCSFLRDLTGKDPKTKKPRFYPISRMEIKKVVPTFAVRQLDRIEVTVECSAFFRIGTKISGPTGQKINVPSGA